MKGMKKSIFVTGAILCALLTGCSSSGSANTADYNSINSFKAEDGGSGIYAAAEEAEYNDPESGNTAETPQESVREGRKLIRTASLSVETLEFDKLLSYIQDRTNELGGYVERLDIYNGSSYHYYDDYYDSSYSGKGYANDRSASLTIRIPKDSMDSFLGEVAENSNITNRSEQEQDVTLNYVDLESHKAVLLAEQERLLQFLEQAETVEDMISIESRLSDVRYEIESMERSLRTYDNQIDYSTISLNISEVVVLTPITTTEKTVWDRISEGFMSSLKNIGVGFREFFIGFIVVLPYLILFALFVLLILWIIFFSIKVGTKKRLKKEAMIRENQSKAMQQMNQNGMMLNPYSVQSPMQGQRPVAGQSPMQGQRPIGGQPPMQGGQPVAQPPVQGGQSATGQTANAQKPNNQ